MKKQGIVYLVGAGPGDPGLMTIKGRELLASCNAVVYDHLASEHFLGWVPGTCRKLYVGKQAGRHSMKQEEINELLVTLALSGLTVVRLKGGDPFVFGRGGEEILALEAHKIPYVVVPGDTSAVAVAEYAGRPVTHRAVSRSFHVITGHMREGGECLPPDFENYGSLPGTLVFLMGLGQLPAITQRLITGGKSPDTPAAVIERGTLPGQRVVRAALSRLHDAVQREGIRTPAVIVVGETAAYDMKCSALRPLSGIRVGITGTEQFAGRLTRALEAQGAQVSWVLDMKVISHAESAPMKDAYKNLEQYTWIVFTSANGVRLFFLGLRAAGRDYRSLGHVKFAVIGEGTGRELERYGFQEDYMPDSYCAEALGQGLCGILTPADRLLIARSKGGSPVLTRLLGQAGILFDDIPLYEVKGSSVNDSSVNNSPANDSPADKIETLDYLTFASASGVRAYFERMDSIGMPSWLPDAKMVCIGDITARELERSGHKAHITASSYHIGGLVQAIIDHAALSSSKS